MKEYIGFISNMNEVCIDENQPIVRCRDCAYICNREYANGLEFHTCSYFDSEHAEVEPDGFCAWSKRREPRAVEDMLVEFYGKFAKAKYGEDSEVLSHYADELRELLGGDGR